MASMERHVVSTRISISLSRRQRETVAPRKPETRRSSGRTFSSKWSRYLGNCATEARADQRRKMVPDAEPEGAEAEVVARFSLLTTTFQGRTSHFFARPLRT